MGAGLSRAAGHDKPHRRLNDESKRRAARDIKRQMGANINTGQPDQGTALSARIISKEQMPPRIPRGADEGRKSVPASGVPRMYGAPRVAIVGNRLSAGILTDGKETCA
jgi:hypothetical protein